MKTFRLLFAAIVLLSAACDRQPRAEDQAAERLREEQRQADEQRLLEIRDAEQRLADREAALQAAQTDAEREKIRAERDALERDRAKLTDAQRRAEQQQSAKERERLAAERKRAADEAARDADRQARAEQKLDFFYDALDPDGDWIELDPYGFVWKPRLASNPRWRPYTDGKWVWTEYGWTWAANERFGWATYHYGRWAKAKRLGWIWVPGSEWAPAWVAWRRSDDYVGWAPLPPEAHSGSGFTAAVDSYYDIGPSAYTFVPVQKFGDDTYVDRVVEPERNVTIINETTNVTNITYQRVENKNVVFNAGPDITVLERRSEVPLKRFKVERVDDPGARGVAEQRGGVLRMAAPFIAAAAKAATAPKKVRERAAAEEVDRGWDNDRHAEPTQRVRAKFQQEAREAEEGQRRQRPGTNRLAEPASVQSNAAAASSDPVRPAATPQRRVREETVAPASTPGPIATPATRPERQLRSTPVPKPTAPATPTPAATPAATPVAVRTTPVSPAATPATRRGRKPGATRPETSAETTATPPTETPSATPGRRPAAATPPSTPAVDEKPDAAGVATPRPTPGAQPGARRPRSLDPDRSGAITPSPSATPMPTTPAPASDVNPVGARRAVPPDRDRRGGRVSPAEAAAATPSPAPAAANSETDSAPASPAPRASTSGNRRVPPDDSTPTPPTTAVASSTPAPA
ncbi:MAG TPA: DUF6600 domain-containing protein, partial [Chthoniobacteraceae bacterium]|nr:DUF6600 domain-containing protein [Chthoniobacteraceae bacterium]